MKNLDPVIIEYLRHYAQYVDTAVVSKILGKSSVESDEEANTLLDVLDAMYKRIEDDAKRGLVVFRQPVHIYDADKVGEVVVAYLEELGYEHVTAARNF